ncbi:hypothetical protein O6H91_17G038600 [Diphasiastrum complanatum]|uniref:Uncharacterized protein n=2 Tax=Diphasiastrum complanatum TaxID=34168 RepID=A0ACC2B5V7_DIPCM|nr:hypothetical protein O6H91_Y131600 [Diphasiastrum complanatum]KAJ7525147.1 hypothetical protein O6H91_17G038600 [Diphasiastrum complanatum]KAJ7525148.1 hypothetical protein O6H91_17G038600 [Diphasiastrum complanatum]
MLTHLCTSPRLMHPWMRVGSPLTLVMVDITVSIKNNGTSCEYECWHVLDAHELAYASIVSGQKVCGPCFSKRIVGSSKGDARLDLPCSTPKREIFMMMKMMKVLEIELV